MANLKTTFTFQLTGAYTGTECSLPLTIKGNRSQIILGDSHRQNTTHLQGLGLYRYGVLVAYGTEREASNDWYPEFYLYPMKGYEVIAQKEMDSFWAIIEKERDLIRKSNKDENE